MLSYLDWQFVKGPAWLMRTFWNVERALLQFFSVGLMLRTLFAHWHKDAVQYQRGSFSQIFISFAWNQISRAIGFIVRSTVLAAWLVVQIIYLVFGLALILIFLAAPFVIVAGLIAGVSLMVTG